jgi:PAS domain S-box-containing protein
VAGEAGSSVTQGQPPPLSSLRCRYFTRLSELLSQQLDARALMQASLPLLVETLGVDGASYAELSATAAVAKVLYAHSRAGTVLVGEHRAEDYVCDALRQSVWSLDAVDISDVHRDPRTSACVGALSRLGVEAWVSVPMLQADARGGWSILTVFSSRPRTWDEELVALLKEAAAVLSPALEQGRTRDELRRSEARFRRVFEHAPTGIALTDDAGRLVQCNAEFARLVGRAEEELRAQPVDALLHQDEQERGLALDRALRREDGRGFEFEGRLLHGDGRAVWVHESVALLDDDASEPSSRVVLLTDVTQRREGEAALRRARDELEARVAERTAELQRRAEQLRRLTGELTMAEQRARKQLARVLHDHLQQLLASARMRVELLARERKDPHAVAVHLDHMERCLEEAITASRSLSVELSPPRLHEFGLAAGLEWLAEWMREKHGLEVALALDEAANPDGEDVRTLVFESVRELLFNAIKHSGVRQVSLTLAREGDARSCVTVADRGRGFDPSAPPTGGVAHLGLGLPSVRERLGLLGGAMHVESAVGAGTTVRLVVPRRRGPPDPPLTGAPAG